MGERSHIYVMLEDKIRNRNSEEKYKNELIARYFQWNYGERMISRARATMEWLQNNYIFIDDLEFRKKLINIMQTNFDMKDSVLTTDLIQEALESVNNFSNRKNIYEAIYSEGENHGSLYIHWNSGVLKYVFEYNGKLCNAEDYIKLEGTVKSLTERKENIALRTLNKNLKFLSQFEVLTNKELESLRSKKFQNVEKMIDNYNTLPVTYTAFLNLSKMYKEHYKNQGILNQLLKFRIGEIIADSCKITNLQTNEVTYIKISDLVVGIMNGKPWNLTNPSALSHYKGFLKENSK